MRPSSYGNSQVRRVIELDENSGVFELDEDGYTRFIPSADEKADIEKWLGEEIEIAERENRLRLDAQAENRETYSAVKLSIPDARGMSLLPSHIARVPAEQIIASTHNNVMRPTPIFSLDPYFDAQYPVLMPTPEYNPQDPETAAFASITPGTAAQIDVDAETISRRMERGIDFMCRERLNFEEINHRVIDGCVIEGYSWVKTCRKKRTRTIIRPKADTPLVDLNVREEVEYATGSQIQLLFIHDSNMLRPNLDQHVNELPWLAERDPKTPDDIRAAYANGEYFLFSAEAKNKALRDAEVERLASHRGVTVDESKRRTDSSTRNVTPERTDTDCDVREVWAYRWLKVKNEETGETERKRFSLVFAFHAGARKLMAAHRNFYDHQNRIHTVFSQHLDGSSTVGIVKPNQIIGTYAVQSELKNAHIANNFLFWNEPTAPVVAEFFAANPTIHPGMHIPGKEGADWGVVRGGAEHASLMPLIQWNAGAAQEASRQGDYETRGSAPSHTSPNVVSMLLDRGGQTSVLFLSMLNRGWSNVIRLYLETARQFEPLGEVIPVREPKTRAITNTPFRYPIGEALDNFNINLTAAKEAASRERDPDQIAGLMDTFQRHATFMLQPIAALIDPATTEEQSKMYRKIIEGGQKLLDRLISTTRVDEESFNLLPEVDAVIKEKAILMAQMKAQQEAAANAANQAPIAGDAVPADAEGGMAGFGEAGTEPALAGSAPAIADEGLPVA